MCDQDRHDPSWALAELPALQEDNQHNASSIIDAMQPEMGLIAEQCKSHSIWELDWQVMTLQHFVLDNMGKNCPLVVEWLRTS